MAPLSAFAHDSSPCYRRIRSARSLPISLPAVSSGVPCRISPLRPDRRREDVEHLGGRSPEADSSRRRGPGPPALHCTTPACAAFMMPIIVGSRGVLASRSKVTSAGQIALVGRRAVVRLAGRVEAAVADRRARRAGQVRKASSSATWGPTWEVLPSTEYAPQKTRSNRRSSGSRRRAQRAVASVSAPAKAAVGQQIGAVAAHGQGLDQLLLRVRAAPW